MTANQIAYWSLQEDKRSHLVNEIEMHRSNKAREVENERHNLSTEKETSRHNVSTEGETRRSNIAKENLQERSILENIRHNKQTEILQNRKISNDYDLGLESNAISRQRNNLESQRNSLESQRIAYDYAVNLGRNEETSRHNKATESETSRHNTTQEYLGLVNTGSQVASTILKSVGLGNFAQSGKRSLKQTSGRQVPYYGSK